MIGFGQWLDVLNGFKYFDVLPFENNEAGADKYGIQKEAIKVLEKKGLLSAINHKVKNGCDVALISFYVDDPPNNWFCGRLGIKIENCENQLIYRSFQSTPNVLSSYPYEECYQNWYRSISKHFEKFQYAYDSTLNDHLQEVSIFSKDFSEKYARDYLEQNKIDFLEGIWEFFSNDVSYRLFIKKVDYKYNAYVLERSGKFFLGDLKASIETAFVDEVVTINWKMSDKVSTKKTIGTLKNNSLIEFTLGNNNALLYKVYPKNNKKKRVKSGEWAGNGSGIIISKSGYIVTNHHVIDDADDIEVEFILDDEVQKFNAEIVQSDKVNDLSIIKIVDINFDGVKELPYNFKTRSSDVGTKVYAFGYPMALSIMGKEIKVTDGIISSKTGYDGDITKYQISAPIQGGNSGGPLFDDKGNFIGINSAKLNVKIADNVGYSIKTSYVLNLIDILPKTIDLPSNKKLASLPLTEQIKEITKYVVLVKVR